MVPVDEVVAFVLHRCPPRSAVQVDLADAAGLVLAQDVISPEDVPPFDNTAVDGYAVRAGDVATASPETPVDLDVIDEVAAGRASDLTVGRGQAIRIMTGAPMPAGADAAVMVENTERLDGGARVRVRATVPVGAAVRRAGDDVIAGARVLRAGTPISGPVAGVLASVNARTLSAYPRATVAVLSTGDELVDDGSVLRPGQIRESNRTMLLQLVADTGARAVDYGIVPDDEALLEQTLRRAASACDAVVTSGGVSMGDYDVVKAVLSRIADMRWMQVAIRPAKPLAFGMLDDAAVAGRSVPVFGLPGNPVSSLVSFELFTRPALRRMMGHEVLARPRVRAVADAALPRHPDGKVHYVRATASFADDGRVHVRPVAAQGSHQLAATATANALVQLPDGDGCAAGHEVDAILLSLA